MKIRQNISIRKCEGIFFCLNGIITPDSDLKEIDVFQKFEAIRISQAMDDTFDAIIRSSNELSSPVYLCQAACNKPSNINSYADEDLLVLSKSKIEQAVNSLR